MPKISVIIPVYNVEKYLSRCLDSVVNQTFDDIEIICVNDGSTDGSLEILEKYKKADKRIKVISQKNAGQSVARNNGLKCACGEYISFLDSDDWIDVNYYECLYNTIVKNDADIAVAGVQIVNGQDASMMNMRNMVTDKLNNKLKNFSTGGVWDKLFKADLFKQYDFSFPCGRYYEDNIIVLKTAYFSRKMAFTNNVFYYYFVNPGGTCRSMEKLKKKAADRLYSATQMMNFARKYNFAKMPELKDFILRTVIADFISKKSPYYKQTKKILGAGYVFSLRVKKFIHKIIRFWYAKNDNKRVICGIKINRH